MKSNEVESRDEKLNLEKVRLLIEDIVRTAGSQLLAYKIKYRGEVPEITDETGLTKKVATDFRTFVDLHSDKLIHELIRRGFRRIAPGVSIDTEETDQERRKKSRYECIIDPLDGTIPFQGDLPLYGVTFALRDRKKHETVAAAFCGPELGDESEPNVIFSAVKGNGAFLNGKTFKPTFVEKPLQKVVFTTDRGKHDRQDIIQLEEAMMKKDNIRYQMIYASSSASLARVLLGKEDGYATLTADPWDIEALALICKQAGLTVRNRSNEDWKIGDASILVMPLYLRKLFDKRYQAILDRAS